ncbi:hypothetical protein K504DRAFT_468277 [Pleomassaria siparia CBS 279.74]|uniref:DUF676 domain-containing protein n=1 Tax=Pleomassaria siparia CBS 279.74 TaxID=1314801 RepID=A0A6G1K854_9PLEO|nr:hypothetical protein K504DRAFT_468277 [Pleomassaria siparia CBS 279.74]
MPRSPLSFLKRGKRDTSASLDNQHITNHVTEPSGSVALTAKPSSTTTTVLPSPISPIDSPGENLNLDATDGRFGIKTISNPADADLDICFVHGLTGDRETTWTHSNGTFTPDLVRARFPSARIVSYGYDANVVGLWKNASGEGLRGHGKALAYAISNSRPNEEAKRPLFFIAHSLGGLVTEQALLVSLEPNEPRLQSIAPCTVGIVFMGTPHSGSYLATWGYTLARLLHRFRRTNKDLLSLLKQRSEVLKAVEEVFQRQLTADGVLKHVKVFCFYETLAVDVVGFVVPEESATMLPHPNCGIDANHMDMTKFTSSHDPGFINLEGVLDDWIKRDKRPKTPDVNAEAENVASSATMTFNTGPIKAGIFQAGTGNAGRDINHGNVTNQSAGRDWVNRDKRIYARPKRQSAADGDSSSDSE